MSPTAALDAPAAPATAGAVGRRAPGVGPTGSPSGRWLVPLALAVPAVALIVIGLVRVHNGWGGFDLSIYDQALWRASQGAPGVSSIIDESLLEDHFAPGVLLFVPLYRLAASPAWLIGAQGLAAWAAVFLIVSRLTRLSSRIRAVVGGALLISPPVAFGVLNDVHSTVLAIPFALAAWFALDDDKPVPALVFGLAAALFRTEVAFGVLAAFVALPRGSKRRWPAAAVLLAYVAVAMHFEHVLGRPGGQWDTYYGHLGESAVDVATHPWRIIGALVATEPLGKLAFWLVGGGFVALARPRRALPAVVVGLPVLLSHWVASMQWGLHYDIAPTLFLVAAGVPVLNRRPELATPLFRGVAILSLVAGPFVTWQIVTPTTTAVAQVLQPLDGVLCLTEGIPRHVGVSASAGTVAVLAHRHVLYTWPQPFYEIDESMPAVYRDPPRPDLARQVSVVLRSEGDPYPVPEGFVVDARAGGYERFRRVDGRDLVAPATCGAVS